jgi:hypothetical protein
MNRGKSVFIVALMLDQTDGHREGDNEHQSSESGHELLEFSGIDGYASTSLTTSIAG